MFALPKRSFRWLLLPMLTLSAATLIAGCRANKQPAGPTSRPMAQESITETPISVPQQAQEARPVKQGKLPLVYLVESAATLRIVDVTNSAEMLVLPVSGRTTVSLTENSGLRVGGTIMKYPSLPSDHIFAIYLLSNTTGQNVIRSSSVRPGSPQQQQPDQPGGAPPKDVPMQPLLPTNGTPSGGTP